MEPSYACGSHAFSQEDQEHFAAISGDYNPMHMDKVEARRTPAGACVVHGMQSMLWALEQLAPRLPMRETSRIEADFAQFLFIDETATLHLVKQTQQEARAELRVGDTRVSQYVIRFESRKVGRPELPGAGPLHYSADRQEALPLSWQECETASGTVAYCVAGAKAAESYPALAAAFGEETLLGLLSLTRLVGMVAPGLHSTFHRVNVNMTDDTEPVGQLYFATTSSDRRFGVTSMAVRADGIEGSVKASRRQPPTAQSGTALLRGLVGARNFLGHTALVIGGSRGLGEVTAKLLAAGGANTFITFAQGEAEARAVVADIVNGGGRAQAFQCDVEQPVAPQLARLPSPPNSVYFFATPRISVRTSPAFSTELFHRFTRIYVAAFYEVCTVVTAGRSDTVQFFYPSSVFVEQPTKNMAEYAMAKAAGEVLSANLTRFTSKLEVDVVRLPRLPTDQTASMIEQSTGSVAEAMLPVVERVEGRVRDKESAPI